MGNGKKEPEATPEAKTATERLEELRDGEFSARRLTAGEIKEVAQDLLRRIQSDSESDSD